MNDSNIKELIEQGEGLDLEFMREVNQKAIGQTVTAFLNTAGGKIIIGIDDSGKIVGVLVSNTAEKQIEKHLSEEVFPGDAWSVTTETIGEKKCIVIDVPAGLSPPYSYKDGIFIRRGAQSATATATETTNLITGKQNASERWERLPTLGSTIKELDDNEIEETRLSLSERLINLPENKNALSVLEALNLARYGQILNSAYILFAKDPQRRYPQIRVRAARFAGEDQSEFVDNKILEGHCFNLIEKINGFLQTNLAISSSFEEGSYTRSDKPLYPPLALREAVMNALVHRDYSAFDGSVSIALYSDRFEIWNPGKLPEGISVEDLKKNGISRPRNPDIAHIFYLRRFIELWGSGTKRIVSECLKAGLPEPEWEEVGGGVRLIIRLTSKTSSTDVLFSLNDRQINYLNDVGTGYQIDVKDYLENFGSDISERTARRDLSEMVSRGYLKLVDRGNRKIYVRTEKPVS